MGENLDPLQAQTWKWNYAHEGTYPTAETLAMH